MLSPYWTISQIILSSLDSNQEIDTDSIKDNPGPILLEFSFGERDKKLSETNFIKVHVE